MTDATLSDWPRSTPLLWVEFLSLFVVTPVGAALLLSDLAPINILLLLTPLTLWLLARTPDFEWREFWRGPVLGEWKLILGFTVVAAVAIAVIAVMLIPGRFLEIFRYRPDLWLMIMVLYPLFSALPQEIIFRVLYFRRYGRLFANRQVALLANVAVFVLAHLFFGNPVTLAMTAAGGLIFAWAYLRSRSMLLAVVLHSIAGQLIFTSGLGVYFYHGAIGTV